MLKSISTLIPVIQLHLTADPKILMLFDLEVILPKSYRSSMLAVKMSIIVLFITMKVETDLMSNGEGLDK